MQDPARFWMIALAGVALYCAVQAVRDFRAKHHAWAAAATLSAVLLVTMPHPTHAVKIDLPIAD